MIDLHLFRKHHLAHNNQLQARPHLAHLADGHNHHLNRPVQVNQQSRKLLCVQGSLQIQLCRLSRPGISSSTDTSPRDRNGSLATTPICVVVAVIMLRAPQTLLLSSGKHYSFGKTIPC